MTILVVDDHKIFLDSISMLLRDQLPESAIFRATSGREAIEMITKAKPNVLLLDINMPEMNGLAVAEHVNKKYPSIKIIVLTNVNGEAMVLNLMRIVHGFLFKDVDGAELKHCIKMVLADENYFCEEVKKMIFDNMNLIDDLPNVHLSKREASIIKLLAKGKTSKEISLILGLKEKTITSYRENLFKKTKTKNATELVAFAFHNSLI